MSRGLQSESLRFEELCHNFSAHCCLVEVLPAPPHPSFLSEDRKAENRDRLECRQAALHVGFMELDSKTMMSSRNISCPQSFLYLCICLMSCPLHWNKSIHEGSNYIPSELLQTHFEQLGFISKFITHLQSVMNKGGGSWRQESWCWMPLRMERQAWVTWKTPS